MFLKPPLPGKAIVHLTRATVQTNDRRRAIVDFEAIMFARAEEPACEAEIGLDGAISENGLDHVLRSIPVQTPPGTGG